MKLQEILRNIFPHTKPFNESSKKSFSPLVGEIIVVSYATKRKVLKYLGVVQSTNGENFHVQYLESSPGKTFPLKLVDEDEVAAESVLPVIKTFSVNTQGSISWTQSFSFSLSKLKS